MRSKKGFTLVELVIVIAIIAILAAVLIPTFAGILERAKQSKRLQHVTSARNQYISSQEKLPSEAVGLIFEVDGHYYKVQSDLEVVEILTNVNLDTYEQVTDVNDITIMQPIIDNGEPYKLLDANKKRTSFIDRAVYVEYGMYPKTIKDDAVTVGTSVDANGYYTGSDGEKYEKVYSDPYASNYSFSNGRAIKSSVNYYFKVEPIIWKIMEKDTNSELEGYQMTLLCEDIIDTANFNNSRSNRTINGKTVYPNNYQHSYIRSWLNSTFLNKFTNGSHDLILTTHVDNSPSTTTTTSNTKCCDDTYDKIYLFSVKDMTDSKYGYGTYYKDVDYSRKKMPTDYAFVKNVYYDNNNRAGYWWTRSPASNYTYYTIYVSDWAHVKDCCLNTMHICGVAPALTLNVQ